MVGILFSFWDGICLLVSGRVNNGINYQPQLVSLPDF